MSPKVSVVIPAYNAGPYIEEAVSSCLMQDCNPEIIVVDDCSTDDTYENAKGATKIIRLPENRGAANALNVGIEAAQGEYVAWLSADDAYVETDKLSRQMKAMEESGADFSYYSWFLSGPNQHEAQLIKPPFDPLVREGFAFWAVLAGPFNPINGSSLLFRKSSFEKFGRFKSELRNVDADGELELRWLRAGAKLARIEGVGVFYRTHDGQTSGNNFAMMKGMLKTRMIVVLGI